MGRLRQDCLLIVMDGEADVAAARCEPLLHALRVDVALHAAYRVEMGRGQCPADGTNVQLLLRHVLRRESVVAPSESVSAADRLRA